MIGNNIQFYFEQLSGEAVVAYLYSEITGQSAVVVNTLAEITEQIQSQALAAARQFHLETQAGEWEPAEGEEFVRRQWTVEDLTAQRLLTGIEALDMLESEGQQ